MIVVLVEAQRVSFQLQVVVFSVRIAVFCIYAPFQAFAGSSQPINFVSHCCYHCFHSSLCAFSFVKVPAVITAWFTLNPGFRSSPY